MSDEDTERSAREDRRDRRRADRRRSILEAARAQLLDGGIAEFEISKVAARADVSKASVYYYFESKEELISDMAADSIRAEVEMLSAAIDEHENGVDALVAMIQAYVKYYGEDFSRFRLVYFWPQVLGIQQRVLTDSVYPLVAELNDRLEQKLIATRDAGGLVSDAHPRKLANLAWVTAQGLVSLAAGMDAVGGSTRFSLDELCEEACRSFWRARA